MLFMTIISLLAVFDIKPLNDSNGIPIIPKGEMGVNLLVRLVSQDFMRELEVNVLHFHSQPVPFGCSIVPRSEKHRKLLQEWVEG